MYGEGKNVAYRTWNSTGNLWTAESTGPVLANNAATLVLDGDPNSNEIMVHGRGLWENSSGRPVEQQRGGAHAVERQYQLLRRPAL